MVEGVQVTDFLLPMDPGETRFVLDISSDDDCHFLDEPKFSGSDDYDWLQKLLQDESMAAPAASAGDDSDEVVVVKVVNAKSKNFSPMVDADDDDCVILDGDPNKVVSVNDDAADGDSDDLYIVGEKGQIACRDYPHPRHLCLKFPFRNTSHSNHCTLCHCYVCDSPAPCANWGTATLSTDHCHATDKEEIWKTKRKTLQKEKTGPDVVSRPFSVPPLTNPTPPVRPAAQLPPPTRPATQLTPPIRPATQLPPPIQPATQLPYSLPVQPQMTGYSSGRNRAQSNVVPQHPTRDSNYGVWGDRYSRNYYAPTAPVFKRSTVTLGRSFTMRENRSSPQPHPYVANPAPNQNLLCSQSVHLQSVGVAIPHGSRSSCIRPPSTTVPLNGALHSQQQTLNQQPLGVSNVTNYWSGTTMQSNHPQTPVGGNNSFTASEPTCTEDAGLDSKFVEITVADIENWLFED